MVPLTDLWLAILVSGVFVFIVSSVVHMALPIHKKDFRGLANEDAVLDAIRSAGIAPGEYVFPYCATMQEMQSEEMKKKHERGPVGFLTVRDPKGASMGKSLGIWFVFTLVVGVVIAYVASFSGPAPGTGFGPAFRLTGTIAILAYATTGVMPSIWKGQSWGTAGRFVFDSVLYGLATGAAFGWLWPGA